MYINTTADPGSCVHICNHAIAFGCVHIWMLLISMYVHVMIIAMYKFTGQFVFDTFDTGYIASYVYM